MGGSECSSLLDLYQSSLFDLIQRALGLTNIT